MVKAIPDGFHTVSPSMTLKDSKKALEFYQKAFGAKVLDVFPGLDGKGTMHAVMQIGNSIIMMGDEMVGGPMKSAETLGYCPISLFVYVEDVDAAFKQAVAAGVMIVMPVGDMFWGDRACHLKDPFGYQWMIATHKRDMNHEQIKKEAVEFFAKMSAGKK